MKIDADRLYPGSHPEFANRLAQLGTRVAGRLQLGLYHRITRYCLRRDLTRPLERPKAKIPIEVRPLKESDVPVLLAADEAGLQRSEVLEIAWRRLAIERAAKGGYVAVDLRSDTPCYMQFLLGAADQELVDRLGTFPALRRDEALLEGAFTPARHRGLGIMSEAMALIAERASALGARYVITFVDHENIPSLKGCQRAGFFPHMLHHSVRLAFGTISRDRFEAFAPDDPRREIRF